jgi:hypothetical protein
MSSTTPLLPERRTNGPIFRFFERLLAGRPRHTELIPEPSTRRRRPSILCYSLPWIICFLILLIILSFVFPLFPNTVSQSGITVLQSQRLLFPVDPYWYSQIQINVPANAQTDSPLVNMTALLLKQSPRLNGTHATTASLSVEQLSTLNPVRYRRWRLREGSSMKIKWMDVKTAHVIGFSDYDSFLTWSRSGIIAKDALLFMSTGNYGAYELNVKESVMDITIAVGMASSAKQPTEGHVQIEIQEKTWSINPDTILSKCVIMYDPNLDTSCTMDLSGSDSLFVLLMGSDTAYRNADVASPLLMIGYILTSREGWFRVFIPLFSFLILLGGCLLAMAALVSFGFVIGSLVVTLLRWRRRHESPLHHDDYYDDFFDGPEPLPAYQPPITPPPTLSEEFYDAIDSPQDPPPYKEDGSVA